MERDPAQEAIQRAVLSALHRSKDEPWGEDGWRWERVLPRDLTGDGNLEKMRVLMDMRAVVKPGQNVVSPGGYGLRMKLEIWRNAHYFVHLWRDELVPAMGPENLGAKDGDFEFPKMVWLSFRHVERGRTDLDWRHLQRIKNNLVGKDHEGVMLFPAEHRVVDTADQFHILVFDQAFAPGQGSSSPFFPFGWLEREVDKDVTPGATQRER